MKRRVIVGMMLSLDGRRGGRRGAGGGSALRRRLAALSARRRRLRLVRFLLMLQPQL